MDEDYQLHPPTYEWTVRLFSRLRKVLGINIKLHGDPALLAQGDIFLFNHFVRIETFLPHYLIHRETGAFCRCIATKAIFKGNESFRKYLGRVGVIPNDHDEVLPMLVADIIRGRKVVIYPEGGMIKDRRVIDHKGKFRIYSHKAGEYRKHHAGAAVLATAVDTFKLAVRSAEESEDWDRIDNWVEMLDLKNREHLLFAAHRPTRIVPGNITFFPINTGDNFLNKGAGFLNPELSPEVSEELIVEANLLLKNTDMDMRLGRPVCLDEERPWWERKLQKYLASNLNTVEDFFTLKGLKNTWVEKAIRKAIRHRSGKLRDKYMEAIYKEVTVNLNHLISTIILNLSENNVSELEEKQFYLMLYLAIKNIQQQPNAHLHRSLRNPKTYADIITGENEHLKKFLQATADHDLIEIKNEKIYLLDKLKHDFEVQTVRIENTLIVYANEMAPVVGAIKAVNKAIKQAASMSEIELANYHHDDEIRNYEWNHHYYSKPRFDDINRDETATESGRPYFELPDKRHHEVGVLLVHGFLASPAEMRPLANKLLDAGYPVYGVRLPGHGTSPVDLREQSWEDWLFAVRRAYQILAAHVDKICLVGFSTGGALSLIHASEKPDKLVATVVANPPVKFKNKNMMFVPLIHNVSQVVRWASSLEGVMPYRSNNPEHARINYRHIPVRGVYELVRMNYAISQQLEMVECPCLLLQSSNDPVVAVDSAKIILNKLTHSNVTYIEVNSDRHGIVYENTADTHKTILQYIEKVSEQENSSNVIKEKHKWAS